MTKVATRRKLVPEFDHAQNIVRRPTRNRSRLRAADADGGVHPDRDVPGLTHERETTDRRKAGWSMRSPRFSFFRKEASPWK